MSPVNQHRMTCANRKCRTCGACNAYLTVMIEQAQARTAAHWDEFDAAVTDALRALSKVSTAIKSVMQGEAKRGGGVARHSPQAHAHHGRHPGP